jgi:hypothetical protein
MTSKKGGTPSKPSPKSRISGGRLRNARYTSLVHEAKCCRYDRSANHCHLAAASGALWLDHPCHDAPCGSPRISRYSRALVQRPRCCTRARRKLPGLWLPPLVVRVYSRQCRRTIACRHGVTFRLQADRSNGSVRARCSVARYNLTRR